MWLNVRSIRNDTPATSLSSSGPPRQQSTASQTARRRTRGGSSAPLRLPETRATRQLAAWTCPQKLFPPIPESQAGPDQALRVTDTPDQVRQKLRPAPWLFLVTPPTAEIRAEVETAGSPEMEACLRDDTHSSSESMPHRARGATSPRAKELSAVSALMMEMVMISRGQNCSACVRSRSIVLFEVSMVIVRAMIR